MYLHYFKTMGFVQSVIRVDMRWTWGTEIQFVGNCIFSERYSRWYVELPIKVK